MCVLRMFFLPVEEIRTLLELRRFFVVDKCSKLVRTGSTRTLEAVLFCQEKLTFLETCEYRRIV